MLPSWEALDLAALCRRPSVWAAGEGSSKVPHVVRPDLRPLQALPSSGIHIFASQLHTHQTGRKVVTVLARDGRERAIVNRDDHYSPHFQVGTPPAWTCLTFSPPTATEAPLSWVPGAGPGPAPGGSITRVGSGLWPVRI